MSFITRWWWILLLGPIAAAIPAAFLATQSNALYESEAVVLVISDNGLEASERLTNTYADLVLLRPVLTTVKTRLSLALAEEELEKKITVINDFSNQLVRIEAKDGNANLAAQIANTTATVFVERTLAQLTRPAPEPVPGAPPAPVQPTLPAVRVVEEAIPAAKPTKPNVAINAGLAAALGLLVAASIGIGLDSIGRGMRPEEA